MNKTLAMSKSKFVKRKRPNYKRALLLIIILAIVLLLFSNIDQIVERFLNKQ